MFNQLSGINALMYYAPDIFEMAGAGKDAALLQAVAVGATNLVFTMAAMAVIDHFGRRKLMLVGSIGYILSLGATAWAFYPYGTDFTPTGEHGRAGQPAGVHRLARVRPGGGDLGLHQRDLPQPRPRPGAGAGQLHPLVMAAAISWTFPDDRRAFRRPCLRLLRRDDGRANCSGCSSSCPRPRACPWRRSRRSWGSNDSEWTWIGWLCRDLACGKLKDRNS